MTTTPFPVGENAFHYLVESVTDYAIYMLDTEGRVQTWNPGASRLKGYSLAEIQGEHFARFFTLEDRHAGKPELLLDRARRDDRVESEGWRVRKDSSRFWALATIHAVKDDNGALIGFAKVTRDMS